MTEKRIEAGWVVMKDVELDDDDDDNTAFALLRMSVSLIDPGFGPMRCSGTERCGWSVVDPEAGAAARLRSNATSSKRSSSGSPVNDFYTAETC